MRMIMVMMMATRAMFAFMVMMTAMWALIFFIVVMLVLMVSMVLVLTMMMMFVFILMFVMRLIQLFYPLGRSCYGFKIKFAGIQQVAEVYFAIIASNDIGLWLNSMQNGFDAP